MHKRRLRLLITVLALNSVACVKNTAWRLPPETGRWRDCAAAKEYSVLHEGGPAAVVAPGANRDGKGYTLSFVEFDDFGEFFSPCQVDNAVQAIADGNNAAVPDASGTRAAVVVVFVHGWKNNASDKTGNVWGFRESLKDLVKNVAPDGSPVVGIYLGWRGAVVDFPLFKNFTFYDRRNTATHVSSAHFTETLMRIMRQTKGADFQGASKLVVVGHSFGGLLLEHAITQTLVNSILPVDNLNQAETPHEVTGALPLDLLVFVNEAGPALEAKPMLELLARHQVHLKRGGLEVPLVASITSTGDAATRVALPAAQFASRPKNNLRNYPDPEANFGVKSQGSLFLQSTANTGALQSHRIGRAADPEIRAACEAGLEFTHFSSDNVQYRLVRNSHAKNTTPYWAMQMPPEIVPDHSKIFRQQFRDLLEAMLVPTPVRTPADCDTQPKINNRQMTLGSPMRLMRR